MAAPQPDRFRTAVGRSRNGCGWFPDSLQTSSAARWSGCVWRAWSCPLQEDRQEGCCGHCPGGFSEEVLSYGSFATSSAILSPDRIGASILARVPSDNSTRAASALNRLTKS